MQRPFYFRTRFSSAAVSDKSRKTWVAPQATRSAALKLPVATPMEFAPMAWAQAMSCGVSPMIQTRCGREIDAELFLRAGEGDGAELVAVGAVVGEGAELEVAPDADVAELEPRAFAEVAGEQRLVEFGVGRDGVERGLDAGQHAGVALGHA